jgi:protein TonB
MFETAVLTNGPAGKRFWTTCAGVTGQCALVACAIVIPMLFPAGLPRPQAVITWIDAPGPPPRRHVAPEPKAGAIRRPTTEFFDGKLLAPVKPPTHVNEFVDPPPEYTGRNVPGGVGDAGNDTLVGRLLERLVPTVAVPAPHPVERPTTATAPTPAPPPRYKLGGVVKNAILIERVEPVYPPIAIKAHIGGVVHLEGIIGVDGRIRELRVLDGHFMLTKAALEAVSRWVYKPTLLNGEPVEVVAPITVTFNLR